MRIMRSFQGSALLIVAACALSACGGGGSGTAASTPAGTAPPSTPTPPAPTPPAPTPPAPTPPPVTTEPLTLQLSASTYSVAQSAGSVTINVMRSSGSSMAASVSYGTSNGTAVSGTDYTASSGKLSWNDGDASAKSFNVAVSKTPFSGSKTFSVALSNASGADVGLPANAVVTINGSGAPPATGGSGPAAKLAAKLGLPSRLLLGLGTQSGVNPISAVQSQVLKVDIYDMYLGAGDWTSWNAPPCDYVCVVADAAKSIGAIPMYTYYQMANNGDGNISVVNDAAFMATYWSRMKTLFQDIAALKTPALVNVEPDFWGYIELNAPGHDPAKLAAVVSSNPDCATQPNTVAGLARCVIVMARKYASNAYVGFPPSPWGGNTNADVVTFMNALGAQDADFIVEETLDRDAGCFEVSPLPSECGRGGTGYYWDESNQTHPNFQDHLAQAQAYHTGIGNLPIIWWQTPEGVPSTTPGGTPGHYRDNRVHYFLTHPDELVAVGGLGVVFSNGAGGQTSIGSDGGQFQSLSGAYMAAPAVLP
jgi:hypothetical protein